MIGFSFKPKIKYHVTEQDILDSVEVQNQTMGHYFVSNIIQFIQSNNIIDSGAFLNSVMFKTDKSKSNAENEFWLRARKDELLIGSGLYYAVYIEDGTSSIPPRPAFRYTIDTKMKRAQELGNIEVQKFLVRRARARG